MPTRLIRDGILTSERVNALSAQAELFYRRLMSVVDDYGRYTGNPRLLRSACYPLRNASKLSDKVILAMIDQCERVGLVETYDVDGKSYLVLLDFRQRIHTKAKFPAPPGKAVESRDLPQCAEDFRNLPKNSARGEVEGGGGGGDGDEDGGEDEGALPRRRGRLPKVPIPDDFAISDDVREWARSQGIGRLEEHFEAFVLKCRKQGYAYADWDAAFRQAIREDWAKLAGTPEPRERERL